MYHPAPLSIALDRKARMPLAEQIGMALRDAIHAGRLAPGVRLPSWHDLAAQLGVARGTVRVAYERLRDEQLIHSAGAAGTRVAWRPPMPAPRPAAPPLVHAFPGWAASTAMFQVGVPARDAFPSKTWSRLMGRAARAAAALPPAYPDPRGEAALRTAIAGYLAIARGIACGPEQVLITNGHAGALALALRVLARHGDRAWIEEPGYPAARDALRLAGAVPVPVPVDAQGLDVDAGIGRAADARLAIVTPGQQAPLGVTLSLQRRHALLDWANQRGAWIVEDDYLGELQLQGRATPALAAMDRAGRVLHIGTFSKTISPTLRLGFLVVPAALVDTMAAAAATCAAAPSPAVQGAVAAFIGGGHFLRHLRHMKRLYAERRHALAAALRSRDMQAMDAGLAVLLRLPDDLRDTDAAAAAHAAGLAPSALSTWYQEGEQARNGLLLGVTNVPAAQAEQACTRLMAACRR